MVKNWSLNILKASNLLLLFSFTVLHAGNYELKKSFAMNGSFLSSDKLGNGYAVKDRFELLKIDPEGNITYIYSNNQLGPISFVGTGNPLKILLFYEDFSTIVTLDNTLSQTSKINLFAHGTNEISAACIALDNNIWIYDEVRFKLIKVDEQFNMLAESEDMNVLLGMPVRANFLLEKDNELYVNDSAIGILVFDTYGTYDRTIPIKGLTDFQKQQDKLIFFKDGKLQTYHTKTFKIEEVPLPKHDDIVDVRIEKDRLFIMRKNRLDLYAY